MCDVEYKHARETTRPQFPNDIASTSCQLSVLKACNDNTNHTIGAGGIPTVRLNLNHHPAALDRGTSI